MYYGDESSSRRDTALVCENGHWITGHTEDLVPPPPRFCERCGAPTMHTCKLCYARIPGDFSNSVVLGEITPPAHCTNCGQPYPWREAALERAKRTARMEAEIHNLDQATVRELDRFALAVAEDKATLEDVSTFGRWFKKKAGSGAAKAIAGALKDVATDVIAAAIVKSMGG